MVAIVISLDAVGICEAMGQEERDEQDNDADGRHGGLTQPKGGAAG